MRRLLVTLALVSTFAGAFAVAGQSKGQVNSVSGPLNFKVRIIQQATVRTVRPPDGNAGDLFSTTLRLFAEGSVLGFSDGTPMGTMLFQWSFTGAFTCSAAATGCKGTTDIATVTRLPGGTLTAAAKKVDLAHGMTVPILSGTGIFKGATGTIQIAPAGVAVDVFHIVLPSK